MAATDTVSSHPAKASWTSDSEVSTATMRPRGVIARANRPRRHQLHGVRQTEHAGHAGSRVLAQTVPDERGRPNAPGLPQCGERELERKNRGLRARGVVHQHAVGSGRIHDLPQRAVAEWAEALLALLESRSECRLIVKQRAAHADVLRTIASEQECHLHRCHRSVTCEHTGFTLTAREVAEQSPSIGRVVGHDRQPAFAMRSASRGRQANVLQTLELGARGESPGKLFQRGGVLCRESQEMASAARLVRGGDSGRFLQHHVGVDPAEPERTDAGQSRPRDWPATASVR